MLYSSKEEELYWSKEEELYWSKEEELYWSKEEELYWSKEEELYWSKEEELYWSKEEELYWSFKLKVIAFAENSGNKNWTGVWNKLLFLIAQDRFGLAIFSSHAGRDGCFLVHDFQCNLYCRNYSFFKRWRNLGMQLILQCNLYSGVTYTPV